MAFKCRHILLENTAIDEASFNQLLANIVNEVPENQSPVVAWWINMDHSIDPNVHDSRVTKQTGNASSDKEVDLLRGRIGDVGVEQPGPRRRRRIADETGRVRLKACHPATRAYEGHHFADDAFRLRYVDQNEAHMGTVERRSRQSRVIRITLADLDLRQRVIRYETAR